MKAKHQRTSALHHVLDALIDPQAEWQTDYLLPLPDLEGEEAEAFLAAWPQISPERKLLLLEAMEQHADENFMLDYEQVCRIAITDSDPQVRFTATRALGLYHPLDLVDTLRAMLQDDPDENVRAVCASNLGYFVYLGELEEIRDEVYKRVFDSLLAAARGDEAHEVRRRALESLGFASRPEVEELIEDAFAKKEHAWRISALSAMGNSASSQRWQHEVMTMLNHPAPAIRFEAVRAAGELALYDARPRLLELLEDTSRDIRLAAAWALSQIGGQGTLKALEKLQEQSEDEEERAFLEEAIANLMFNEDMGMFDLLEIADVGDEEASLDFRDDEHPPS
jgi:hypothetical protein